MAERRIIDLINRRYVSYFCNASVSSAGGDAKALAWVKEHKGKSAYFSVYTPDGEQLYAGGAPEMTLQDYFDLLSRLLREHPEYNGRTAAESAVLDAANADKESADAQLAAGRLSEEIGDYPAARQYYDRAALPDGAAAVAAQAHLGLARIARFTGDWKAHAESIEGVERLNTGDAIGLACFTQMERGYALLHAERYEDARALLEAALDAHPAADNIGELHFYAGLAHYFLKQTDWANYHWCWIMRNVPADRHYMRAYVAIDTAGGKWIYPNEELKYKGKGGATFGTGVCLAAAMKDYETIQTAMESSKQE